MIFIDMKISEAYKGLINESNYHNIVYHGTNIENLTIKNIKINYDSEEQFYGPGFYATPDIELAKNYGSIIYEVKVDGNFMKITNPMHVGSLGTFQQYLEYGEYSDEDDAYRYYKEIQLEVRNDIINAGYDGAYDNNQIVIYYPENNIILLKQII